MKSKLFLVDQDRNTRRRVAHPSQRKIGVQSVNTFDDNRVSDFPIQECIDTSSRMLSQRKKISEMFGTAMVSSPEKSADQFQAVAQKQPKSEPNGKVAQRLIAYNTSGTPHQDYALMKVIQQLRKKDANGIVPLSGATDFSGMGDGEKLYIASHGSADSGDLAGVDTNTLIGWLNSGARGVPNHFGGIVILSCYGGEAIQNKSLAERVADGLNVGGKTVEGAKGFGFGSPLLAATGKSSVLSQAYRVFYQANDIAAMKAAWRDIHPTHGAGVLVAKTDVAHAAQGRTVRENLLQAGYGGGQADGWIETLIKRFKSMTKNIEKQLADKLAAVPGDSVAAKIAALEESNAYNKPDVFKVKKSWERIIQQQYALFNDYYLWTDEGNAYSSFGT